MSGPYLLAVIAFAITGPPDEWARQMDLAILSVAERNLEQALNLTQSACGSEQSLPSHRRAMCHQLKGHILSAHGDFTPALQEFGLAESYWRQTAPELRPPEAISALAVGSAIAKKSMGRLIEAEAELRQALRAMQNLPGDKGLHIAECLFELSRTTGALGKLGEAESFAIAASEAYRSLGPQYSRAFANSQLTLAQIYMRGGDYRRSLEAAQSAEAAAREHATPITREYAGILVVLAASYRLTGDPDRALPLARKALQVFESPQEKSSEERVAALREAGLLELNQNKLTRAAELLQMAVAAARSQFGEDSIQVAVIESDLGHVLSLQDDFPAGESVLRHALQTVASRQAGPFAEGAVHLHLAQLFERAERHPAAETHFARSVDLFKAALGQNHIDTARALECYARFLKHIRSPKAKEIANEAKHASEASKKRETQAGP